jgi:hypothetical protein
MIAFFSERVPLCKGEWKPEGDTATAYVWLVWLKGMEPQAPFWIPPDCRTDLEHPADVTRFTSKPVMTERRVVHFVDGDFVDVETGEITPAGVVVHTVDTTKAAAASSCDIARNGAEISDSASSEPAIAASPTLPAAVAGSTNSDIEAERGVAACESQEPTQDGNTQPTAGDVLRVTDGAMPSGSAAAASLGAGSVARVCAAGSVPPEVDLEIPAFLRRNPDNSVPSVPVASPREAQSGISGEAGG